MEQLQLLWVSLAPALGTLVAIIIIAWKIVSQFQGLRGEVKDDKTINEIRADNRRLNAMHRQSLEKIDELEGKIDTLVRSNQELTSAINRTNRGE